MTFNQRFRFLFAAFLAGCILLAGTGGVFAIYDPNNPIKNDGKVHIMTTPEEKELQKNLESPSEKGVHQERQNDSSNRKIREKAAGDSAKEIEKGESHMYPIPDRYIPDRGDDDKHYKHNEKFKYSKPLPVEKKEKSVSPLEITMLGINIALTATALILDLVVVFILLIAGFWRLNPKKKE
mgnify:CR=1 FL=1